MTAASRDNVVQLIPGGAHSPAVTHQPYEPGSQDGPLPFATNRQDGQVISLPIASTITPHMVITAEAGAGATTVLRVLCLQAARNQVQVRAVISRRGLPPAWPGIQAASTLEETIQAISDTHEEMIRRHADMVSGAAGGRYPRILLAVDDFEVLSAAAAAGEPAAATARSFLGDLLLIAGEARINVAVAAHSITPPDILLVPARTTAIHVRLTTIGPARHPGSGTVDTDYATLPAQMQWLPARVTCPADQETLRAMLRPGQTWNTLTGPADSAHPAEESMR